MKPVIAVTMGDPSGVGPEILLKALNDARVKKAASVIAVGDLGVLKEVEKKLRLKGPADGQVISVTNLDIKKQDRKADEAFGGSIHRLHRRGALHDRHR